MFTKYTATGFFITIFLGPVFAFLGQLIIFRPSMGFRAENSDIQRSISTYRKGCGFSLIILATFWLTIGAANAQQLLDCSVGYPVEVGNETTTGRQDCLAFRSQMVAASAVFLVIGILYFLVGAFFIYDTRRLETSGLSTSNDLEFNVTQNSIMPSSTTKLFKQNGSVPPPAFSTPTFSNPSSYNTNSPIILTSNNNNQESYNSASNLLNNRTSETGRSSGNLIRRQSIVKNDKSVGL